MTGLALWGALWLAVATTLAVLVRRGRRDADEEHTVTTDDGWTLPLFRHRAQGEPRPIPVVFGHGFMMNRHCWALTEEGSLPRALAARGHDVFVAEYRGSGRSRAPQGPAPSDEAGRRGWTFQEHAQRDLPAILEGVCAITGSAQVHWVGHSMGGLLAYTYAAWQDGGRIARMVTLGSPVRPGSLRRLLGPFGPALQRSLPRLPRIWARVPLFLALPTTLLVPELAMRTSGTARYLSWRERAALLSLAFEDTSPALAGHFLDAGLSGGSLLPDGSEPILARVRVPLLAISGRNDALASPRAVRMAIEEAGAEHAVHVDLGGPSRAADEPQLGHACLISGRQAIVHVLPLIASWLEAPTPRLPPLPIPAPER